MKIGLQGLCQQRQHLTIDERIQRHNGQSDERVPGAERCARLLEGDRRGIQANGLPSRSSSFIFKSLLATALAVASRKAVVGFMSEVGAHCDTDHPGSLFDVFDEYSQWRGQRRPLIRQ